MPGSGRRRTSASTSPHSGPLAAAQKRWAAVLACGEGAALTGLTVLEHAGVKGVTSPRIHVAVEHKKERGADEPTIRPTRVCRLDEFVHPAATPPQVRLEYAALAAASAARTAEQAHAILTAVVQQERLTVQHLRHQLAQLPEAAAAEPDPRVPGRHRRRRAVAQRDRAAAARPARGSHARGSRSTCDRATAPTSTVAGRRTTSGSSSTASCTARRRRGWTTSAAPNELAIAQGGTRLRWPGFAVRRQPDRVVDQATRAQRAAGWSPT